MKRSIIKITALALVAVMLCVVLASCGAPASNPKDAEAALKKNDYLTISFDDKGLSAFGMATIEAAGIKGVKNVVSGTNDEGEHITILYFEDNKAASDEWKDAKKYSDDEKKDSEKNSDWVVKKSGSMIYFGTKAGIKAAK